MTIENVIEQLLGNGVIGLVLAWFMLEYSKLVKQLLQAIEENSNAFSKNSEAIHRMTTVIEKCEK